MRLILLSFTFSALLGCSALTWNIGPYKSDAEIRIARREWCARQREYNICAVRDADCMDFERVCD